MHSEYKEGNNKKGLRSKLKTVNVKNNNFYSQLFHRERFISQAARDLTSQIYKDVSITIYHLNHGIRSIKFTNTISHSRSTQLFEN